MHECKIKKLYQERAKLLEDMQNDRTIKAVEEFILAKHLVKTPVYKITETGIEQVEQKDAKLDEALETLIFLQSRYLERIGEINQKISLLLGY